MNWFRFEFNPNAIPRTTTRQQWRAIDRWRRVSEKKIMAELALRAENAMIYGTSHPEMFTPPLSE